MATSKVCLKVCGLSAMYLLQDIFFEIHRKHATAEASAQNAPITNLCQWKMTMSYTTLTGEELGGLSSELMFWETKSWVVQASCCIVYELAFLS
jgi:hypothetical protein